MLPRRLLVAGSILGLLLLACGGASSTPIDNSGVGSSGTSGGSSSGGGGTSGSVANDGGAGSSSGGPDAAVTRDGGPGTNPGLVTCGAVDCKTNGGGPSIGDQYCCFLKDGMGVCKEGPITTCDGHRLLCDEAADCKDGNVCCAEPGDNSGAGGDRVQTRCLATCITGAPRVQVCKTDAECKDSGGKCQPFQCEGLPASFRFCTRPDGCK